MKFSELSERFFDSSPLLKLIHSHWKNLMYIGITAAVVSSVVALLIPPKYKSTVILFPAQTNSLAKSLFIDDPMGKKDVLAFGEEEQAEQMLQILYSDEILEKLNLKYNLLRHYDIEEDDPYKNTNLGLEYEDNVSFKRTQFHSIEISVLDHYPDTAAMIANDIASYIDSVKNRVQKDRALLATGILKDEYNRLETRILGLEEQLSAYRQKGVLDFETQVEQYSEQLGIALNKGNKTSQRFFQDKLDTLAKYGSASDALTEQVILERERLVELLEAYEEARVDAERNLPHTFIVNKAVPAEKKSYPIRWLIVVLTTCTVLLVSVMGLIFFDALTPKNA